MAAEPRKGGGGRLAPSLILIYAPALVLLVVVGAVSRIWGIPQGDFTRDPLQMLHQPVYLGLVSYAGILVWCAAATMGIFAGAVLRGRPGAEVTGRFLLWAGVLTGWVAVDDLFMLHDIVIPQLTHVREQFIYMLYAVIAASFAVRFKEQLRQDRMLIFLTVVFAVVSVVMDTGHAIQTIVGRPIVPQSYLVEDGTKLLAQVGWAGYVGRRSWEALLGLSSGG
jgi:hypothetical protein